MEKINKKLEGWKSKLLSQAGRTLLIRTVASTIPTYHMQSFALPKVVCKSLNTSFKISGGIGLRLRENLNLTLLGKIG